jgi:hypothetical protein
MNLSASRKLNLQRGLIIIVFVVFNSGCANPVKTQSIQTSPSPTLYPTSTISVAPTEAVLLQPSPVPTIQFSSSLDATALPSGIVQEMLRQINKDEAVSVLRQFTGEEPICIDNKCDKIKNRFTGSKGLHWAKEYLYKAFVDLGYSVELQDWSLGGYSDQNLIATKTGVVHPDEKVYLVAHIDGVRKFWGLPFPAADDNASGAVDLLEVARVASNYSFDRTLVFFFSTGEEVGRLGANGYLNALSQEELSSIKYVINVDMVGYDENGDGMTELWHGNDPASLTLTQMMKETILSYQLNLSPELAVGCG